MRDAPQITETRNNDWKNVLVVIEENHTASWQTNDGGYAEFEATMHSEAEWLSLTLTEASEKSRRETMMTLTPKSARALYEFLKNRFEPVFTPEDDAVPYGRADVRRQFDREE